MRWTVGRTHKLGLAGLLAAAAMLIAGGSNFLLAVALVIGLSVLLGLAGLGAPRALPTRLAVHGLTAIGLAGAILAFPGRRIDAVIAVLALGLVNRYLLHAGRRDDFVLIGAVSVMVAMGTTITPGLVFLPLFLLYFAAALMTLLSGQILSLSDGPARAQLAARPMPGAPLSILSGAFVFALGVYALVSMLPQHHFGRWFSPGYFARLPGASDVMRLSAGGAGGLQDRTVVLRVRPSPGLPPEALQGLYARVYSLDRYEGGAFSVSAPDPDFRLFDAKPKPGGRAVQLSVRRMVNRWLPQPLVTLGRSRASRPEVWQARQRLSGSWVASWRIGDTNLRYKVALGAPVSAAAAPKPFIGKAEARALALPADLDPRVRQLAARLTEGAQTPAQKIALVRAYFSRGFRYSLDPLPGKSADPLARFLFEAKAGHCELYAAAVAVLLRAAGVPARVNTGYFGGHLNTTAGLLEFSQQDAHAWAEVFDPETGWRFVDATPPDNRTRRAVDGESWFQGLIDAAEAAWFNYVVDFDDRSRREVVRGWLGNFGSLRAGLSQLQGGGRTEDEGAGAGALVLVLSLLLLLWAGLRLVWRQSRVGLGQRLRRALGERDGPRRPLSLLLEGVPPDKRSAAEAAIAAYEALSFSARPPPISEVRQKLRALERSRP